MVEYERLGRLLNDLYLCTGIKCALLDGNAREIYTSSQQTQFCTLIANEPYGRERCLACDKQAYDELLKHGTKQRYICHAGLYELAMPFTEEQSIVATIICGQILDDSPLERQWQRVRECCRWYPDEDELYRAFLLLARVSTQQMLACMEIVEACVSEIRLSGLLADNQRDDIQRLQAYIDTHYQQRISVDDMSRAISCSRTRLYSICRDRYGKTPLELLNERRISKACEMLNTTEQGIGYIARSVGINDENYFSKVFKKYTGRTASEYRLRL